MFPRPRQKKTFNVTKTRTMVGICIPEYGRGLVVLCLPEYGTGEGWRVEAEGAPEPGQGRYKQAERKHPHARHHQHYVAPVTNNISFNGFILGFLSWPA